MTTLFRTVLSCEVLAVFVMAAVSLARLVLKKAPKRLTIFLWLIVCLRLLVPVRLEAPVSLVPEPASVLSSEVEHISETGELSSLSWSMEHPNVSSGTERAFTARQWGSLAFDLAAVSLGHRRGGAFSGAASEALSPAKKASGRSGNFARCVCLR